jgi:hypothetical protein
MTTFVCNVLVLHNKLLHLPQTPSCLHFSKTKVFGRSKHMKQHTEHSSFSCTMIPFVSSIIATTSSGVILAEEIIEDTRELLKAGHTCFVMPPLMLCNNCFSNNGIEWLCMHKYILLVRLFFFVLLFVFVCLAKLMECDSSCLMN